ncbi:MAG: hypothetical protein KAI47_11320 [Deltaproteobacteria bacterium]|nr:hypothetical protein [Deltaproteobacteria bacterium]
MPPPPLVEDKRNTPPKILFGSLVPDPGSVTPVTIPGGQRVFTINGQVIDPDPQRLVARFFFDSTYDTVVQFAGRIPAEPSFADGRRNFSFELSALCDQVDNKQDHLLELYVADADFTAETGRDVVQGGARDNVAWRFNCDDLPGDGGI